MSDDVRLARAIRAALHPDSIAGGGWNRPEGFSVAQRVAWVRLNYGKSWATLGEAVIRAAAVDRATLGASRACCRWGYAAYLSKVYGAARGASYAARRELLGEPCRKCVNRWKGKVGVFKGRLRHRETIKREVATRVHRMKLAQTPLTPPPTPSPRRSTSATRQPATRALRTSGTRQSFNVQAYDQQVMREWKQMMARRRR